MNFAYSFFRSIRCRVPAPSVGFGEGGRLWFARQFSGKGTSSGDETRRGRSFFELRAEVMVTPSSAFGTFSPQGGEGGDPVDPRES
jgi:hypothetical protein